MRLFLNGAPSCITISPVRDETNVSRKYLFSIKCEKKKESRWEKVQYHRNVKKFVNAPAEWTRC